MTGTTRNHSGTTGGGGRFREFQRRNNASRQVQKLFVLVIFAGFYMYLLLLGDYHYQPPEIPLTNASSNQQKQQKQQQLHYQKVLEWNQQFARNVWMEQAFYRFERRELANRLDLSREQRRALRKQQERAFRQWKTSLRNQQQQQLNIKQNEPPLVRSYKIPKSPDNMSSQDQEEQEYDEQNEEDPQGENVDDVHARVGHNLWRSLLQFMILSMLIRNCQSRRRRRRRRGREGGPLGNLFSSTGRAPAVRRSGQDEDFERWVQALNAQRQERGEAPLSADTLRMVLQLDEENGMMMNSNLSASFPAPPPPIANDGNDYEALLQFQQQAGPSLLQRLYNQESRGISSQHELESLCPARVIFSPQDDLLLSSSTTTPTSTSQQQQHQQDESLSSCVICIQTFQLGEQVRTLPCSHSFHVDCIDPWLRQKALCPICKHPVRRSRQQS